MHFRGGKFKGGWIVENGAQDWRPKNMKIQIDRNRSNYNMIDVAAEGKTIYANLKFDNSQCNIRKDDKACLSLFQDHDAIFGIELVHQGDEIKPKVFSARMEGETYEIDTEDTWPTGRKHTIKATTGNVPFSENDEISITKSNEGYTLLEQGKIVDDSLTFNLHNQTLDSENKKFRRSIAHWPEGNFLFGRVELTRSAHSDLQRLKAEEVKNNIDEWNELLSVEKNMLIEALGNKNEEPSPGVWGAEEDGPGVNKSSRP